ncbi:hypothetical protein CL614_06490 [archaeon]|nr:hypothetical protein [archaeon]|tara:strand:+ start:648 stop:908 length:261 start_codon:yes stop_codon:yes gene_type:complete
MDLTSGESKILNIISIANLAKKTDIERHLLSDNTENVNVDEMISTAIEGLMRKSLITKIHPIGVACYIITRQGNSTLMDLGDKTTE